jgi:hypothetical protein
MQHPRYWSYPSHRSYPSYPILTAFLLLVLSGLIVAQPLDSTLHFRKGSATHYKSGALRQCDLAGPTRIQGYQCQNTVWFYENGNLQEFQLAESSLVCDVGLPAETWVSLREDGTLDYIFLPHTAIIQGCPCAGSWLGREGCMTSFYPNSRLRNCFLAWPATIRNVPCQSGAFSPVLLYDNGGLKSGWLSQDYAANDTVYSARTRLTFNEEGEIIAAYRRSWLRQVWTDFLDLIF